MESQTYERGHSHNLRNSLHSFPISCPCITQLVHRNENVSFTTAFGTGHSQDTQICISCNQMSFFSKLSKAYWTNFSSRLGIIAHCSTSSEYQTSCDNDIENNEDRLPGFQTTRQETSSTMQGLNIRQAAEDMQVNQMIEQETGMDRLRAMYALGSDGMFVQEETRTLTTVFYRSVVLGFMLNAIKAAQTQAKQKKHLSSSEAVMKMGMSQMSESTRVLKEAAKNTVRLSAFAASLIFVSQSISAYRNTSSPWEYSFSATLAMAVAGYGKAPRPFATGLIAGAVLGGVGGSMICSMLSSSGVSQEQRTVNRIRTKFEQKKHVEEI